VHVPLAGAAVRKEFATFHRFGGVPITDECFGQPVHFGLAADTDPSAGDEFKDSDCKDAKRSSTRTSKKTQKGPIVSTSSNTDGISDNRSTTSESLKFLLSHPNVDQGCHCRH
jgi:hypothetical protein